MNKAKLLKDKMRLDREERRLNRDIERGRYVGAHARCLKSLLRVVRRLLKLEWLKLELAERPQLTFAQAERHAARVMAFHSVAQTRGRKSIGENGAIEFLVRAVGEGGVGVNVHAAGHGDGGGANGRLRRLWPDYRK